MSAVDKDDASRPGAASAEWYHFIKDGGVEGSNYKWAVCRYCLAYRQKNNLTQPEPIVGRIRSLQNHLKVCTHYSNGQGERATSLVVNCTDAASSSAANEASMHGAAPTASSTTTSAAGGTRKRRQTSQSTLDTSCFSR
eukprot:GHVU01118422.1.p1 GENE.GHVU01118422.1~~GHVU01118422.1.p1  ORF type:complete len:139 (+),score=13.89 GHVU01118422.1:141-557(+)